MGAAFRCDADGRLPGQGEIAARVAQALDVALSAGEKRGLEATSTRNLPAYEAYLRGEEACRDGRSRPPSLRRAVGHYEQAVALDPELPRGVGEPEPCFVVPVRQRHAYAGRSCAGAGGRGESAGDAPGRAEGHEALGDYYRIVVDDAARALPENERARRLSPGSADYATSPGAYSAIPGRMGASLADLEEAQRLDPRSVDTLRRLGFANSGCTAPQRLGRLMSAGSPWRPRPARSCGKGP